MGPTKAIVKGQSLHEAVSGKLIRDGFTSQHLVPIVGVVAACVALSMNRVAAQ